MEQGSLWIHTKVVSKLLHLLKERVYHFNTSNTSFIQLKLELNPKYDVLLKVIQQIIKRMNQYNQISTNKHKKQGKILIICKDKHSVQRIVEFLELGAEKYMNKQWNSYLLTQQFDQQTLNQEQICLKKQVEQLAVKKNF